MMLFIITYTGYTISFHCFPLSDIKSGDRGSTVLCYKSEGRWFDSRWCHWNFLST